MKKVVVLFILIIFVACKEESLQKDITFSIKNPSTKVITKEMGCENCGMNIERFIQTGHAIHTADGKNHYYCSINCCTSAWNKNNYSDASVFAIDKKSLEYVPVEDLFYVIGSNLPAIMSKVSKYAFKDSAFAEQFRLAQEGDTILTYKKTFKMCEEELAKR
jgi:nitrous oxide reductase accessory protein NosL